MLTGSFSNVMDWTTRSRSTLRWSAATSCHVSCRPCHRRSRALRASRSRTGDFCVVIVCIMPPAAAQGNGHETAAGAGGVSEHRAIDAAAEGLVDLSHDLAQRSAGLDWLDGDGPEVDGGGACLPPQSGPQEGGELLDV